MKVLTPNPTAEKDVRVYEQGSDPFGAHVFEGPAQNLLDRISYVEQRNEVAPWTPLDGGEQYTTTAPSASTIALLVDLRETAKVGLPVRWLDLTGTYYNNTAAA